MKKIILCLSCFLSAYVINAQIIPVKNSFQADMAKVIADYPNHFKNLVGELLVENPQSTDYISLLSLKDAEECIVTKYSAACKEIVSWQARMLTTENFDEAEKKFRTIYNSLNNLSVSVDASKLIFKAGYEKPEGVKKFTSSFFTR